MYLVALANKLMAADTIVSSFSLNLQTKVINASKCVVSVTVASCYICIYYSISLGFV